MTFYIISLGCDKTLVDSEHIMGELSNLGHNITDDIKTADIIAINTCCFIGDALEESIDSVLSAYNDKNKSAKVAVFGCMAKRFYKDILDTLPEADIVINSCDVDTIVKELTGKTCDKKRFLTGMGFSSYLKIAEGCNKRCTYCVIPGIKGAYKSVPMEELISEATFLADSGIRELNIIAQETTLYGVDLYGKKSLHILLNKLSKIQGIKWIRLLYAYPEEIYDELIEEIKTNEKIVKYIDMPIQHCNDDILKRMARKTNKADIIGIINKLRKNIPDICIRTTVITGFPGESEEAFNELLNFIKEYRFDRLGCFAFSREEGTKAYELDNQIDDDIKVNRQNKIMTLQQEISKDIQSKLKDKNIRCIIEGYLPEEDVWQGRSYRDAPDVDGLVFFKSNRELISGDFIDICVTETFDYDLMGEEYEFAK